MPRRPGLLSPTAFLRRGAIYKGLFGGSRGWMAVGAVLWAPRVMKRLFGRNEETLTVEKLKGGQFLSVETIKPPSRRRR